MMMARPSHACALTFATATRPFTAFACAAPASVVWQMLPEVTVQRACFWAWIMAGGT
jgi:hypothetical protein